jgi:hypothetical protein
LRWAVASLRVVGDDAGRDLSGGVGDMVRPARGSGHPGGRAVRPRFAGVRRCGGADRPSPHASVSTSTATGARNGRLLPSDTGTEPDGSRQQGMRMKSTVDVWVASEVAETLTPSILSIVGGDADAVTVRTCVLRRPLQRRLEMSLTVGQATAAQFSKACKRQAIWETKDRPQPAHRGGGARHRRHHRDSASRLATGTHRVVS